MSVDLVQLGEDIGEAKAEAEAALAVAEVAVVASALTEATANEEEEGHTCCEHCERDIAELRAMLVSLSDKYDQDMDLISRVLDELLTVEEDVEEIGEEEDGIEVISPETETEHGTGGESTERESESTGHAETRGSSDREEQAETPKPQAEHRTHKRPATSGRIRFHRGR